MNIETPEQWWAYLETNKNSLLDLLATYHPYYNHQHNHKITALLAEKVAKGVRESIRELEQNDPQRRFENYFKETNHEDMISLLNEVWFGMPESYESRNANGFDALCDLCSECWVFQELPL